VREKNGAVLFFFLLRVLVDLDEEGPPVELGSVELVDAGLGRVRGLETDLLYYKLHKGLKVERGWR
jgi:hypothetical protein